ncbi:DUF2779 domain-containing protein [Mesomycoplasma neurolyticum]|uniref:Domain of uncharacterized function(DUF2779) n=1 Tax=Mesomycoplasma neurolyticum TaxID=2120 RepID=A0A449A4L7_9BACT|nr:DUF2779 domain-containing protein [Mesomycoplasma neurolyticum]VEU59230.1 Domain of uncharacterised function(DUF2779) [Mesomycoplasma neurolyticum]
MQKEKILFSHFLRFKTMQPFFVWNSVDNLNYSSLESESLEDENEQLWNFDDLLDNGDENKNDKFIVTKSNVYLELTKKFIEDIILKYGYENIYVVKSKKTDEAIKETVEILKSNKYRIILFGVFEYKNAIARVDLLDLEKRKISCLKLSTSTKIKDVLKIYWNFQIIRNFLELKNASYFLISTNEKPKKGEILFDEIFNINLNKNKKKFKVSDKIPNSQEFFYKKLSNQQGIGYDEWNSNDKKIFNNSIFKIVNEKKIELKNKTIYLEEINYAIKKINSFKNVDKIQNFSELDNGPFGSNPNVNFIVEQFYPEIANFSGKVLSKKSILNFIETRNITYIQFIEYLKSVNARIDLSINDEEILNILNNPKNSIVWYDFEGFSLPFPPIDGVEPYKQIVFQLSIKKTYKNKIYTENIVYDPKKIDLNVFVEIIEKIYSNGSDYFVVFNKSYENTRIKEMMNLIKENDEEKHEKLLYKYNHIIENTIDLADFFSKYKANEFILPSIFFSKLKGYYSIKKIEKLITENKEKLNLKNFIIPYKELVIQNGVLAMSKAIDRYLGIIGDKEWEDEKINLKKYCENDVMAMIMVVEFINWTIKHKDKIKDL